MGEIELPTDLFAGEGSEALGIAAALALVVFGLVAVARRRVRRA